MAKLIISIALFAALLAVVSATTTYTTVVTTTTVDGENRGESCMQEYKQLQRMSQCRMWMQSMMQGGRYAIINPGRRGGEGEHLQQCCQQLEQISSPCRCEALKMMWMEQRPMGEQMQQMKQMVESLPSMCPRMQSPRQCRMEGMLY